MMVFEQWRVYAVPCFAVTLAMTVPLALQTVSGRNSGPCQKAKKAANHRFFDNVYLLFKLFGINSVILAVKHKHGNTCAEKP